MEKTTYHCDLCEKEETYKTDLTSTVLPFEEDKRFYFARKDLCHDCFVKFAEVITPVLQELRKEEE